MPPPNTSVETGAGPLATQELAPLPSRGLPSDPAESLQQPQFDNEEFTAISGHSGSPGEMIQRFKDNPDAPLPSCVQKLGITSIGQLIERVEGTDDSTKRAPTIKEIREAKKKESESKVITTDSVGKSIEDENTVVSKPSTDKNQAPAFIEPVLKRTVPELYASELVRRQLEATPHKIRNDKKKVTSTEVHEAKSVKVGQPTRIQADKLKPITKSKQVKLKVTEESQPRATAEPKPTSAAREAVNQKNSRESEYVPLEAKPNARAVKTFPIKIIEIPKELQRIDRAVSLQTKTKPAESSIEPEIKEVQKDLVMSRIIESPEDSIPDADSLFETTDFPIDTEPLDVEVIGTFHQLAELLLLEQAEESSLNIELYPPLAEGGEVITGLPPEELLNVDQFKELVVKRSGEDMPASLESIAIVAPDRSLEQTLVDLGAYLSESVEDQSDVPIVKALRSIVELIPAGTITGEEKPRTMITPELTEKLLKLLLVLGYESPGEILVKFVKNHSLEFLIQAIRHLYQLSDESERKESMRLRVRTLMAARVDNKVQNILGRMIISLISPNSISTLETTG